ncbi:hypothetical protein VSS74_01410 [Conexibacter stalactiti]|uniref:Resolvase/invertase-type recombinase catalytic domain-containing protein n=1 Tax=Conexibacter stalactiti TaxID=1940611 RepID=A0ABU4HI39_9ACTN|nr:hypothetical protein [Conexibacter stalactiti]MDW5592975.1 hypothetical protein [Conexibacter stalactiti]MEC5033616.1 hypothetical protein [Conexibacter stalactiti]
MIVIPASRRSDAVLGERLSIEQIVREQLALALRRSGYDVSGIRQTLDDRPSIGSSWWAIATLVSRHQLWIVCELRRSLLRSVVSWRLVTQPPAR